MVPEPANRCPSPEKALSIRDGIPGKTKTFRTLTWKRDKKEERPLSICLKQKMSLSHLKIELTVEASEVVPPEKSTTLE